MRATGYRTLTAEPRNPEDRAVHGDMGDIGCWALGVAVLDVAGGAFLVISFTGTVLAVTLGVYLALSLVGWLAFWHYRDEFR